jgi:aminoglycoside phosphotransferase family enzyme
MAADARSGVEPTTAGDVAIAEKMRFLSDPGSYPGRERRVEVIETHFSWVFLTSRHAYKLKKPAAGEGYDFRTIAARRRNAIAEVNLNRRLAPKIYLGVVALTRRPGGMLSLGGPGRPVDWLVKMVRLRADRMLDRRLSDGVWHYGEIEAVAARLAAFFADARRVIQPYPRQKAQLRAELLRSLATLSHACDPALRAPAAYVVRTLDAFLAHRAALFRRRVNERRLIDGHGDLRPEHIYVAGVPVVIDCVEFRPDLRRLDPISEIAFLALECGRFGSTPIAPRLIRRYRNRSGDTPPPSLISFYAAFNAVIRARLAVEHISQPISRTPEEWICRAKSYLAIALKACRRLSRRTGP